MESQSGVLEISVSLVDPSSQEQFTLHFPLSRQSRDSSKLNVTVSLDGFDGHLQLEYNQGPLGPYQGPYDQHKALALNVQLPDSDLNFQDYTEFRHSTDMECQKFKIKDSYENIGHLEKIQSLEIDTSDNSNSSEDEEDNGGDDENLHYTCRNGNCRIPCICLLCCVDEQQCVEHEIEHSERFVEKEHAVTVRSTEEYFNDESFLDKCYLIKHPGIPLTCTKCRKDFLHHICYHLDLHYKCKFCRQNRFKVHAETTTEFKDAVRKHEEFLKTVCPYCKNKFCEPYFKKKHVEFEHEGTAPFQCDHCHTRFQSKQAKEYHIQVHHSEFHEREKCQRCGKTFAARVSLNNHLKYAHSDVRNHKCPLCDLKFKERKNMRVHVLNLHGVNLSKAMLGSLEEFETHDCDACEKKYKNKGDLRQHIKLKHGDSGNVGHFQCDLCQSKFQQKKSLSAHQRMKHSDEVPQFSCPTCGKTFNKKHNMKRHQQTHNGN